MERFQEIDADAKANPRDPGWVKWKGGELMSFKNGLQTLPKAVGAYLTPSRVRLSHTLEKLTRDETTGEFTATFATPTGPETIKARSVHLTSPSTATAKILGGAQNLVPAASRLAEIYQPPVASVVLSYPNSVFKSDLPGHTKEKPLRGFGILFPRNRGIRSLGIIFNTSLFPNRSPPGRQSILTYIGGTLDPTLGDKTEEEIAAVVDEDVRKVLCKEGTAAGTYEIMGVKVWKTAIPQYYDGHAGIMKELDAGVASVPGLFVNGNYKSGVAFGDCVGVGYEDSAKVAAYLDGEGKK